MIEKTEFMNKWQTTKYSNKLANLLIDDSPRALKLNNTSPSIVSPIHVNSSQSANNINSSHVKSIQRKASSPSLRSKNSSVHDTQLISDRSDVDSEFKTPHTMTDPDYQL